MDPSDSKEAIEAAGAAARKTAGKAVRGANEAVNQTLNGAKGHAEDALQEVRGFANRSLERVSDHARLHPWIHTGLWGAAVLGLGILIGRSLASSSEDS